MEKASTSSWIREFSHNTVEDVETETTAGEGSPEVWTRTGDQRTELREWSSGLLHFAAMLAAARQPDGAGVLTADPIDRLIGSGESRVLAELINNERNTGRRQILASVNNMQMLDWVDTNAQNHVFICRQSPDNKDQIETVAYACRRTRTKRAEGRMGSLLTEGWLS